jgi:hypothetical protein
MLPTTGEVPENFNLIVRTICPVADTDTARNLAITPFKLATTALVANSVLRVNLDAVNVLVAATVRVRVLGKTLLWRAVTFNAVLKVMCRLAARFSVAINCTTGAITWTPRYTLAMVAIDTTAVATSVWNFTLVLTSVAVTADVALLVHRRLVTRTAVTALAAVKAMCRLATLTRVGTVVTVCARTITPLYTLLSTPVAALVASRVRIWTLIWTRVADTVLVAEVTLPTCRTDAPVTAVEAARARDTRRR